MASPINPYNLPALKNRTPKTLIPVIVLVVTVFAISIIIFSRQAGYTNTAAVWTYHQQGLLFYTAKILPGNTGNEMVSGSFHLSDQQILTGSFKKIFISKSLPLKRKLNPAYE
jgi:hypothetical protein